MPSAVPSVATNPSLAESPSRLEWLVCGTIVSLSILFLLWLGAEVRSLPYIFDSDEYLHALPALEMSSAVRAGDLEQLLQSIRAQAFYPPLHPMVVSLSYLGFGPSLWSSRAPSLLLLALAIATVAFAVRQQVRRSAPAGVAVGVAFAVLTAVTTPTTLFSSILCMVEPVGLFLVALLIGVLNSTVDPFRSPLRAVAVLAIVVALTLSKYTFPALVLPGLGLAILGAVPAWRTLFLRSFWYLAVVLGWALAFLAWCAVSHWPEIERYLFLYPARGSALGLDLQLYYLELLFTQYAWSPLFGGAIVSLSAFGVSQQWRSAVVRAAFWILLCSLIGMAFVAERSPRHICIILPALWFLCGVGASELHRWFAHRQVRWVSATLVALSLLAITLSAANSRSWFDREVRRTMEYRTGVNSLHETVVAELQPNSGSVLLSRSRIPLGYSFLWQLAADRNIPVREVRNTRLIATRKESDRFRMGLDKAGELSAITTKILDARSATRLVMVLSNDEWRGEPGARIRGELCREDRCTVRKLKLATVVTYTRRGGEG